MNIKKPIKKIGVNPRTVYYPKCNEEQPKFRKPKGFQEIMYGGSNFRCEMNKYGVERNQIR